MDSPVSVSTGLKGFDKIINGLRKGDNVVWQVDCIEDYFHFALSFIEHSLQENKKLVYIRFANHAPLVEPSDSRITTYQLSAYEGFESFATKIHSIISQEGPGTYYVFDCLSDLLSAWATDLMIGNFFVVTCPYLFELDTIAYFALLRERHSHKTIARIRETTQLLLDVYHCENTRYCHPIKVWNRYSPTMFLPHVEENNQFIPLTNSLDATRLFAHIFRDREQSAIRKLDYWDQLFLDAENLTKENLSSEDKDKLLQKLCGIMLSREEKITQLIKKNLALEDLLQIKSRLIGTGYIGGKSIGMLVARSILSKDVTHQWTDLLEPHDSFYIGSDVFYTYVVINGWWKLFMQQKTDEGYFKIAAVLREKMLQGKFSEEIREQFYQIIEYFGQSPFIVRSSSLLEDSYGNAFAGKYESIFCVNQGTPEERYQKLEEAVRRVFASTMNEDALAYRLQRGLSKHDEQMALLVQRVSGAYHGHYFFPDIAGVGVSYNAFVWNKGLDPKAGMLRLVFGLGTRAVNRVEGDYPRMVAMDAPMQRPHGGLEDARTYSQHQVDVLDTTQNSLEALSVTELMNQGLDINLESIAVKDLESAQIMKSISGKSRNMWILTFDGLLSDQSFIERMQQLLKVLENNYQHPVEVEFTINFKKNSREAQINLLQCRPFQTKGLRGKKTEFPSRIAKERIFFQSEGNFMGGSLSQVIKRIVTIDPSAYNQLVISQKYDIARLIGKINKQITSKETFPVILLGPGRWGTTTPSLGVPVSFAEINNFTVMVEVAFTQGHLMPELSFGTHFFHDLVETEIFYVALFPENKDCILNTDFLKRMPNQLETLVPEAVPFREVVQVYDLPGKGLKILADIVSQKIICYGDNP
ncbi:MAG: PEP/pyruvate-binding domain-containing protein [Candidatus Omnitrophica bacterium]|nr:PEP/pyruvate-binding domain-containing protein [Candidatus Omnitrophota bacterium]